MIATNRALPLATLMLIALSGCGATITMDEPTIPAPLAEKIPVDVALRIPAEFEHFVHEEAILGKESWTIDLGRSNAVFFEQLFGFLFSNVTVIGPDDEARDFQFDALIEPSIDGFEFSVPNQSKTEAFAVWIRYRLRVFDSAGNNASNWTVSAYGKSQKQGINSSSALQRAAVLAMRDAAALIVMQLDKATQISALAGGALAPGARDTVQASADADPDDDPFEAEDNLGVFVIGGIDEDSE